MFSKLHKELGAGLLAIVAVGALLRQMVNIEILEPRRKNAERAICQSNLKQIGLAVQMYAQDNNDILPRAATRSGQQNWMKTTLPYLKTKALFACPANEIGGFSYVFNDAYSAPNDGLTSPSGQTQSRFTNASQTALLADGMGDFRLRWEVKDGASIRFVVDQLRLGSIIGRHVQMPNVLFCDGHVAAYGAQQTFAPRTKNGKSYFAGLSIEDD